jgi:Tfp pilus assembly protein PilF
VLPPAPTAAVGSGDSAARVARSRLYLARGDAALAAGMRDTARVAWETALYENPALTDASVELATMLVENGDGWFGRKVIERALHFDPRNPKLLHFSAYRKPSPADSAGH